ncbi:hypothetical protein CCHL11_03147 [Colletotrichum chlorophyti]|uniref:Uncharacterized protein n=1 Tax=Colletotrichum chlorophyti TaxID=708187 RepID=A0A1Q8RG41_9PEZI|nr:hypothetical protein CCHL11_03147 [Colletotrichum chlorophyti]
MGIEDTQGLAGLLGIICPRYVTQKEARQICDQFKSSAWKRNSQVLWSGMQREKAQRWADDNGLQTLTTALGPLVKLEKSKRKKKRSNFMKGASALFAWFIAQGTQVTLLLPLPPHRFHPSGLTSLQDFEEPIIKGLLGNGAVDRILVAHPGAKDISARTWLYELWPIDEVNKWKAKFGIDCETHSWRQVKKGFTSNLSLNQE